jgi:Protein of unknown function (DUF2905)
MAQFLIIIGLLIAAVGVLIWLGVPLGRLPGDIVWRRNGFTLYLPIATSILVSVVLTVVAMFLRR